MKRRSYDVFIASLFLDDEKRREQVRRAVERGHIEDQAEARPARASAVASASTRPDASTTTA